jgi:hypothetical protein
VWPNKTVVEESGLRRNRLNGGGFKRFRYQPLLDPMMLEEPEHLSIDIAAGRRGKNQRLTLGEERGPTKER